ncbi:RNA 2'-phosphotransferase [Candidatus Thorarchaeota archaeon]|nr:MAG: RNA 2'-phosphotransferase [Candidatus Thorarchaeota archaeon]
MHSDKERISRYLAYLLRHAPKEGKIEIDKDGGWIRTESILDRLKISLPELIEIVEEDEKGRYSFEDETNLRIRANQGHSVDVNMDFERITPPDTLYHGTAQRNMTSIMKNGLESKGRHHVHLSKDVESSRSVGRRHGKPIVLEIDAKGMQEDGYDFFLSDNEVFLTKHVPPEYLTRE